MRRTMGGASERILRVAAERFAENGYRGTSIEDIAVGAEISRSSLFWHFGSKEGLLRAVIEDLLGSWMGTIGDKGNEQRGLAAVRTAVVVTSELHAENPAWVRLMSLLIGEASATETSLLPLFIDMEEHMLGLWRRWLSEAAEDGELRPGADPDKAAAIINAAVFGMKHLWALKPEHYEASAMEEALLHVVDCLSAPGPEVRLADRRPTRSRSGKGTADRRQPSRTRKAAAK